jgi:hypothetical protein
MTNEQIQRLKFLADRVRGLETRREELSRANDNLSGSTDISFWNTGNSEKSVKLDSKKPADAELFRTIVTGAREAIREEIRKINVELTHLDSGYVEKGDRP